MGPLQSEEISVSLVTHSPEQTQNLGRELGKLAQPGDVILLAGELGSGKTCLTQGIAWGLGVTDYAVSPSFVLVREYQGRLPIYHMDLYRLDRLDEIGDLGLDDYFYGRGISVVEWADKGLPLLPPQHLLIRLEFLGENSRTIHLEPRGRRYQELVARLRESAEIEWN